CSVPKSVFVAQFFPDQTTARMNFPSCLLEDEYPAAIFPSLESAQIPAIPELLNLNVLTSIFLFQLSPERMVAFLRLIA
ncbi:MAG TPA: hypothetical protein ACQGQW_10850, partial [Xylella fastidiosa subsp. pauca]